MAGVLMSALLSAGCHNDKAVSGVAVGWKTFVPAGQPALTINELNGATGFSFHLPSYLPRGITNAYIASADHVGAGNQQAVHARVQVFRSPLSPGGPDIEMTEWLLEANRFYRENTLGLQFIGIGQTTVACYLGPSAYLETPPPPDLDPMLGGGRNPSLACYWDGDELHFHVAFFWSVAQPLPGLITQDMRDEAMKVVTSMIEDPYVPEAEATMPPAPTAPATDTPIPAATAGVQLPPADTAVVPPTPVTPGPLGCADCKVRQRDQLPVSAQDIQMDSQGKYFIADRGDGCRYAETYRGSDYPGRQEVMLWAPGCEQGWTFLPATGELRYTIP
jgi:hypothetical protein